jgi:hypothetical protein
MQNVPDLFVSKIDNKNWAHNASPFAHQRSTQQKSSETRNDERAVAFTHPTKWK